MAPAVCWSQASEGKGGSIDGNNDSPTMNLISSRILPISHLESRQLVLV
jgi:hypothetical protein